MPGNLRLVVVTGPDIGLEILLEPLPGLRLAIGRSPECTVTIDHETLSRRHFEIFWDGEQFRLADLGSSNGTLLNGEPFLEGGPHAFADTGVHPGGAVHPRRQLKHR